MERLEQENKELRENLASMQVEIKTLTTMVAILMAAQSQTSVSQPISTTLEPVVSTIPFSTVFTSAHQRTMPEAYPWGMLYMFGKGPHPVVTEVPTPFVLHPQPGAPAPQAVMTYSAPFVHTDQQGNEPIFHSDSVKASNRVEALQDTIDEMKREMKALRGKDAFGQNVYELCLVPNLVVPPKFKVPYFDKYKGNTCPRVHLTMYVRKMSTQAYNDKMLVHFFQDSLAGAAQKWYMSLNSSRIRTFHDLANAFIHQYSYNSDVVPDREQLRAMTQGDKETFLEYAQRWRGFAAQIIPPLQDKELTRIFLKTLSPFFYKKMIASAPSNFAEMVGMGTRLEEGVREGRLVKESISTDDSEEDQEVNMVKGWPQQQYPTYHSVAIGLSDANAVPNLGYQPQLLQYQQQYQQHTDWVLI